MFIVANNVRMKSSAEAAVYVKCRSNWTNCVFQCCQVPVFVRIFTESRPVIRSTEMQWSIPQI